MNLLGRLGRIGTMTSDDDLAAAKAEVLREARVNTARKNPLWTEIENDLDDRGRGWRVSASTDAIYVPYAGVVFASGSATALADKSALHFYVNAAGELVFLEKLHGTWSDRVARQAKRERGRVSA